MQRLSLVLGIGVCLLSSSAWAGGTLSVQGDVSALTDVGQIISVQGSVDFADGIENLNVSPNQYQAEGIVIHAGPLSNILPGVQNVGSASAPVYGQGNAMFAFPGPIEGGGSYQPMFTWLGGAITFAQPTTQFGATMSVNTTHRITAWRANGTMIGQVSWTPDWNAPRASFVGIDTHGVPIALLTIGEADVWNGQEFDPPFQKWVPCTDSWIWGISSCSTDAQCDDENPCTQEACVDNLCESQNLVGPCDDDGNLCTDDVCMAGVCAHVDNVDPCDDLDACTGPDTCQAGECMGGEIDCNDDDVCSVDSCDSAVGCIQTPLPDCCVSDADCPRGEICQLGSNSCIPDPNGDTSGADTSGADTSSEGPDSSDESSSGGGESTSGTDDGTSTAEGGEGSGDDDVGGGGDGPFVPFGEVEDGCACTSDTRETSPSALLLALACLGLRRRR